MIYCAFNPLNTPKDPKTGEDIHNCKAYDSFLCNKCPSKYCGDRIKDYMATHARKECK